MRILITNHRIALRTGTELYVGELARSLIRRGHDVVVFSPECGELADQMRNEGLTVVSDIAKISAAPDVIHGQHHLATMIALAAFSECQALYLCHGYKPWQEWPPLHPRIVVYAAVSNTFLKWFTGKNVRPNQFEIVRNGIALERFGTIREAPVYPRSALVYQNDLSADSEAFQNIAAACDRKGISVIGMGSGFQTSVTNPALTLPGYDLVFASGRSAMEAITCGCAVILLAGEEFGELVTAQTLEYHWERNFALGSKGARLGIDQIVELMDRYSAADVTKTAGLLRSSADQEIMVDRLEQLYQRVVDTVPDRNVHTTETESMAAYLQQIAGHVAEVDKKFHGLREGWEKTKSKRRKIRRELDTMKSKLSALENFFSKGVLRRRLWRAAKRAIR